MTTPITNPTRVRPPRQRRSSYAIGVRAVVAAREVKERGWTAKRAAGWFRVNASYVGLALRLNDDDQRRILAGELTLSRLHKDHHQRLAERRAQLAAEHEAKIQAEAQAQRESEVQAERARSLDGVLETVGLDRVVDAIVTRFGPRELLVELEGALRRRDQDLGALLVSICDPGLMMAAIDRATAPPNGGNGARA